MTYPRAATTWEIEPASVLPAQLQVGARCGADLLPEKRLMLAVLEDAVHEFRRLARARDRRGRRLFGETAEWFNSDDEKWPFAFLTICHYLGLEPEAMRAQLAHWQAAPAVLGHRPEVVRFRFRSAAVRSLIGDRTLRRATREGIALPA